MDIRRSSARHRNAGVVQVAVRSGAGNAAWVAARARPGSVILAGGATLEHFRLRVAQSHLRRDLLPSFWSVAGVLTAGKAFFSVPLGVDRVSAVPSSNAVRRVTLQQIDDTGRFPNVAVLRFAEPADGIVRNVQRLMQQRSALDLPTMILPWLGFVWSAGTRRNPLVEGIGLPAAALVQTAFGMAGIELTPGLASGSSCPEAIWQSAVWWHEYYEQTTDVAGARVATDAGARDLDRGPRPIVPSGEYVIRQAAAAVSWED